MTEVRFDWDRGARTGVAEAVLAEGKSPDQIARILADARARGARVLLTRLDAAPAADVDHDPASRTGVLGGPVPTVAAPALILTAGSSDMPVAKEAQRTLAFHGVAVDILADCGVAGLWRLMEQKDRLAAARVIIAVAGMEGALFPTLGGLTRALVIAVPTSVGYGVAAGGKAALSTALATCAPGVVTVNIDNGFGAAAAALKVLG